MVPAMQQPNSAVAVYTTSVDIQNTLKREREMMIAFFQRERVDDKKKKKKKAMSSRVRRIALYKKGSSQPSHIVKEQCESRGGRPGLSVLTILLASVDVKIY